MSHNCRVCGQTAEADRVEAQERMFGSNETFAYALCKRCGCLQIQDCPDDLGRYYPEKYYSFSADGQRPSPVMNYLTRLRDQAAVSGDGGIAGRTMLRLKPNPPLEAVARLGASPASRIADVGCGSGRLLRELHRLGFRDLTGVDPNIPADIVVDDRLRVRKQFLEELPGQFDVVMFHHSLEHIPDQLGVLEAAHAKLADGGACLVRIPLVSSHAWRTYGTSWVQLDAPRHLFLHSEQSMRLLAERAGFQVEKVVYDSNEFQFWGSEVLRQGDALVDPATGQLTAASTAMIRRNAKQWRREAVTLNARGEGDQAAFILRKMADGRAAAH